MNNLKLYQFGLLLKVAACAVAVSLTACFDDSGSGSSDDFLVETRRIVVDEATSSITMYGDRGDAACVKAEDGSFSWKTGIVVNPFTTEYQYFFLGDTLVLRQYTNDSDDELEFGTGLMLVGGKAGNLQGNWRYANCLYEDGEGTDCDDSKEQGSIIYFNFSGNTLVVSTDRASYTKPYNSADLMKTLFVRRIVSCLSSSYQDCSVYAGYMLFEVENDGDDPAREDEFQVVSQSKRAAQLVVNGQSVDIKVNKLSYEIESFILDVTVSANGKSCNLNSFTTENTKPYCSIENSSLFDMNDYEDENGNRVDYASAYYVENDEEFRKCLVTLLPSSASVTTPSQLYKKSAERDSRREKIRDAQERLLKNIFRASGKN